MGEALGRELSRKVWEGVITLPLIPSHPRLKRIFDRGGEMSCWTACLSLFK
jgi:hypothetical protein